MPGYFSFQKLITPRFVKLIYVVGLLAMTASGIGLAIWAGLGLRSATLPTRMGVYYIAIGASIAIVGNLVWRVLCEIWIVLFNIHTLLGSLKEKLDTNLLNAGYQVKSMQSSRDKASLNANRKRALPAIQRAS